MAFLATVWKVNHLTVYHIKMEIISWAFRGSLSKYIHAHSLVAEMKKKELNEETGTGMRGIERVKNREPHAKLPLAFICSIIYFSQEPMDV